MPGKEAICGKKQISKLRPYSGKLSAILVRIYGDVGATSVFLGPLYLKR